MKEKISKKHLAYERAIVRAIEDEIKKVIIHDKARHEKHRKTKKYLNNLIRKIFSSLYEIREITTPKETDKKYNPVTSPTPPKKIKDAKDLKQTEKDSIKIAVKNCWFNVRSRISPHDAGNFRWHLTMLAEEILGKNSAMKISLPFLRHRSLVIRNDKAMLIGVDSAISILDYLRFNKKVRSPHDALVNLSIELLWQGMKLKDIIKISSLNFDPENSTVLINAGKLYRMTVMDKVFWARARGLLRKSGGWFWTFRKRNPQTIGCRFRKRQIYAYVNATLRHAAREIGIKEETNIKQENFRQAGLLNKMVCESLTPACLSSFYGPELPTNVLGIYENIRTRSAEEESSRWVFNEREYTQSLNEDYMTVFESCGKIIAEYNISKDKKDAIKYFQEIKAPRNLKHLVDWIISLLKKRGKALSPVTIERYFEAVQKILIYCLAKDINISEISEDDIIDLASWGDDNAGVREMMLDNHTMHMLRSSINSMSKYLVEHGADVPEINWQKINPLIDDSPRLIYLPEENLIRDNLDKLAEFDDENKRKGFLVGVMGYYLGLRRKEIFLASSEGLRIFGSDDDYIEIFGKGAKTRRVPLKLIPGIYRNLFLKACEGALSSGAGSVLGVKKIHDVNKIFYEHWKEIAPSGLHSLRHGFATRHLKNGEDPLRVAGWMGHESLRVLQNTYDQSLWYTAKRILSTAKCEVTKIPQKKLENFLSVGRTTLWRAKHIKKHRFTEVNQVRKKKGEKLYRYDFNNVVKEMQKKQNPTYKMLSNNRWKLLRVKKPIGRTLASVKIVEMTLKIIEKIKKRRNRMTCIEIFKECARDYCRHEKTWAESTLRRNSYILSKWEKIFDEIIANRNNKSVIISNIRQKLPPKSQKQYLQVLKSMVNNLA